MSAKHLTNPVTLTLTLDDVTWLRAFLDQERSAADVDRQDTNELHTILARRAASKALIHEQEMMTKIIDEICRTLDAGDSYEALARQVAATLPAEPLDKMMPPVA